MYWLWKWNKTEKKLSLTIAISNAVLSAEIEVLGFFAKFV